MSKQVLKLSLIVSAILLFSVKAKAQAAATGAEFNVQTAQVGVHVMALTRDGQFFATSCKQHWGANLEKGVYSYHTASMAFPNSMGDIIFKVQNSTEWELSKSLPLTPAAADKLCVQTQGAYTLRIVNENGGQIVDVADSIAKPLPAVTKLPIGTNLQVRTGLVGRKIVAATANGDFYAIMCDAGMVSSSADFLYPNLFGKIVIKSGSVFPKYYDSFLLGKLPVEDRTNYMPMTKKAVKQICNHPNGTYNLRVTGTQDEPFMDLIGEKDFQADTRLGGRGF